MELSSGLGIAIVIALVLANGFFVATEFAIVASRRSRLDQLAAEGHSMAKAAREVVGHLDAYIAACQLGITMASLALGWIGEPAFAHLVEPPLEALVGSFAPTMAHGVAVGVAFAIITTLHIVIGELAPKGLALQRPEATALWVARPMQVFYFVFRWPITLLNAVGNGVLALAGLRAASGHEMVHSVEELRLLVTGSRNAGGLEEAEAAIAARAFEFADLTAGALMTPRTELDAVPLTISWEELLRRAAASTHSRLLVYDSSPDDVVGALYLRDLFKLLGGSSHAFDLRALLRPLLMIPQSKPADDLLEEMRASRRPLALVLDEYGGTAGMVTLQNLAEALIGRIDEESSAEGESPVKSEPDGTLVMSGLTRVGEFEELSGLELEASDHAEVETLGGVIMARLGRMPEVGDEVHVGDRILRVESLDGRRVAAVRVLPASASPRLL